MRNIAQHRLLFLVSRSFAEISTKHTVVASIAANGTPGSLEPTKLLAGKLIDLLIESVTFSGL